MTSIRDALQIAKDLARVDAEILLMHVLQQPRSYLYAWPERALTSAQFKAYSHVIQQRQQGVPIAYLIGYKEFWSLPLLVTKDVLIPRAETELLVELVLAKFDASTIRKVADIGTGSGAIALALASERKHWQLTAIDISNAALIIAKKNATELQIKNVQFIHGSFCEPLTELMDVIVSNPPYIAEHDPHLKQGDLRFEPINALMAEEQGLFALKTIAEQARAHLVEHGLLLMEHGFEQAESVEKILMELGYQEIKLHRDLAGLPRVTSARM